MITKKDKIFLRTVQRLTQTRRGVPPSFREIQAALGLRSINPVFWRISKLRSAEMIEAIPNRARTIHLTKSGITMLKDEDDMELTKEEEAIILKRRENNEIAQKRKERQLDLLKVAYEYQKWLNENGAGSTFSTFCDEFGYQGDKRGAVFECVQAIRHHADEIVGKVFR